MRLRAFYVTLVSDHLGLVIIIFHRAIPMAMFFFSRRDIFPNSCSRRLPWVTGCLCYLARFSRGIWVDPAGDARSSTLSSGGSVSLFGCSGAGHAQPSAVRATACGIAIASIPHQRLVQWVGPSVRMYARARTRSRKKRAASPVQRPPHSDPSTRRRWVPARRSSG